MRLKSIRWKLPLSYAGIALITAVVMGAVLLVTLRGYYNIQEHNYLDENASAVGIAIAPLLQSENPPEDLGNHIKLLAFLSQVRLQLMDASGKLWVDSGIPGQGNPIMVSSVSLPPLGLNKSGPVIFQETSVPSDQAGPTLSVSAIPSTPDGKVTDQIFLNLEINSLGGVSAQKQVIQVPSSSPGEKLQFFYLQSGAGPGAITGSTTVQSSGLAASDGRKLAAIIPAAGTMYGFELQPGSSVAIQRSSQLVQHTILSPNGKTLGILTVSDGPAIGSEIIDGVARGGVVAALVAILIAAGAGWWVSRRMSAPLIELTESTRRMAVGDLSARANVTSQDEFGVLANAFNEMAGQVEEIVGSLRSFASDAAHELQTPLTALHTNLELAAQDYPDSPNLKQAWQQFHRLETLAADLLDLSRIESSEPGSCFEPVDMASLLQGISEKYASEAEQAGQVFYLHLPDGPVLVSGRPDQLQRAITNLLDNALKFTPPGGRIESGIVLEGGSVIVRVEDDGIGIPFEDQPNLFQRFHRGHNVSNFPGSGLGLAIVQAIIQKHGGQVNFEVLNKGIRFWFSLPTL